MHSNLRERARSEGGFTLIELLVVMIIIAILMAVAVPTFLAQKNNAQKTKVTANIKQLVNAVESCAAGNTDGTYTGCTTFDGAPNVAGSANSLKAFEKGLLSLGAGTGVNLYTVGPVGTQGYAVGGSLKDGNIAQVWFMEHHAEDGTVTKTCGSGALPAIGATAPAPAPIAGSRTCPAGGANAGRWG